MLRITLLFTLLFSIGSTLSFAQDLDIELPPKFFTLRNARLSLGANINTNLIPYQGESVILSGFAGTKPSTVSLVDGTIGGGLNLDLYAPNSRLSFSTEFNYNLNSISIQEGFDTDNIEFGSWEAIGYLKLRFGAVNSRSHFLVMPGASYSRSSFSTINSDNAEGLLQDNFLSGVLLVGLEYYTGEYFSRNTGTPNYDKDQSKIVIFGKLKFHLDNILDPTYPYFYTSSLHFGNFEYQGIYLNIGAILFFRLKKT